MPGKLTQDGKSASPNIRLTLSSSMFFSTCRRRQAHDQAIMNRCLLHPLQYSELSQMLRMEALLSAEMIMHQWGFLGMSTSGYTDCLRSLMKAVQSPASQHARASQDDFPRVWKPHLDCIPFALPMHKTFAKLAKGQCYNTNSNQDSKAEV